MAIPELERARVEAELRKFAARVPEHIRSQLWYEFAIRGNNVSLIECRPHFMDHTQTTKIPFARFTYIPDGNLWSLSWSDSNGRWHPYDRVKPTRQFSKLVAEVDSDPTNIFLG